MPVDPQTVRSGPASGPWSRTAVPHGSTNRSHPPNRSVVEHVVAAGRRTPSRSDMGGLTPFDRRFDRCERRSIVVRGAACSFVQRERLVAPSVPGDGGRSGDSDTRSAVTVSVGRSVDEGAERHSGRPLGAGIGGSGATRPPPGGDWAPSGRRFQGTNTRRSHPASVRIRRRSVARRGRRRIGDGRAPGRQAREPRVGGPRGGSDERGRPTACRVRTGVA